MSRQAAVVRGRPPQRSPSSGRAAPVVGLPFAIRYQDAKALAVAGDGPLSSLPEVVPQMPAVGDLRRLGRPGCGAFREERRAIPADDLDPGSLRQPCSQAGRLPGRQQIHRPTGLESTSDGAQSGGRFRRWLARRRGRRPARWRAGRSPASGASGASTASLTDIGWEAPVRPASRPPGPDQAPPPARPHNLPDNPLCTPPRWSRTERWKGGRGRVDGGACAAGGRAGFWSRCAAAEASALRTRRRRAAEEPR